MFNVILTPTEESGLLVVAVVVTSLTTYRTQQSILLAATVCYAKLTASNGGR